MNILRKKSLILLLIACLFVVTGCSPQAPAPSKAPEPVNLTISAAASLSGAMKEIQQAYESENSNVKLTVNPGSSGTLQQQIENGADVDVFFSAAEKQMKALADKGLLLDDTRKTILENSIVLVIPKDAATIRDFEGLKTDAIKKIALGEPKSVPAGQYAEETLKNLKIFDSIKSKVVYGTDVTKVLTWVETGNADAGMVYGSDAATSDKVKIVASAPSDSHTKVTYPAAVIKASKKADEAKKLLNYLAGDKAKAIYEKYGFVFCAK